MRSVFCQALPLFLINSAHIVYKLHCMINIHKLWPIPICFRCYSLIDTFSTVSLELQYLYAHTLHRVKTISINVPSHTVFIFIKHSNSFSVLINITKANLKTVDDRKVNVTICIIVKMYRLYQCKKTVSVQERKINKYFI